MVCPTGSKTGITLTRDERDELADTLLHALFCLFGNLGILGERRLHDAGHWRKVANVSIVEINLVGLGRRRGSARRLRRRPRRRPGRRMARHGRGAAAVWHARGYLIGRAEAMPAEEGLAAMQAERRRRGERTATTGARESWRAEAPEKHGIKGDLTYHWLWVTTGPAL